MKGEIGQRPVQFREAQAALARRDQLMTGWSWADVWQEEHLKAFTVAKAMSHDILATIKQALVTAQTSGQTFEQFRAELEPKLVAAGWWGNDHQYDPADFKNWQDGDPLPKKKAVMLGSPGRLQTIFRTNLSVSASVGRWQQFIRTGVKFIRYIAVLDERTRESHRQWHNTILPIDDDWWQTHWPPNDWGCRCDVLAVSPREMERKGLMVSPRPDAGMRTFVNKRTGEVTQVPRGIGPGWAYNPGQVALAATPPPPRPKATPDHIAAVMRYAAAETRAKGVHTNQEWLMAIDAATGEVIDRRTSGDRSAVAFGPALSASAADPQRRLQIVHNHPSDLPLSLVDLKALLSGPGIEALVSVGHQHGTVSFATKGPKPAATALVGLDAIAKTIRSALDERRLTLRTPGLPALRAWLVLAAAHLARLITASVQPSPEVIALAFERGRPASWILDLLNSAVRAAERAMR